MITLKTATIDSSYTPRDSNRVVDMCGLVCVRERQRGKVDRERAKKEKEQRDIY